MFCAYYDFVCIWTECERNNVSAYLICNRYDVMLHLHNITMNFEQIPPII